MKNQILNQIKSLTKAEQKKLLRALSGVAKIKNKEKSIANHSLKGVWI